MTATLGARGIHAFDGGLTLTAPAGSTMRIVDADNGQWLIWGADCRPYPDMPNAVGCFVTPGARITFTTIPGSIAEAALHLSDARPCIPAPPQPSCDAQRAALWDGETAAWAARGVTDPDARFAETLVFRVRAGDPAAIRGIAQALGAPYLQITRLRFRGGQPGQADEFVELTNLGGGAQDLLGWSLRSPLRGAVVRFRTPFVLGPGQSCEVYSGLIRDDSCAGVSFKAADVWPDDGGRAVLFYDALALPGVDTEYRSDPASPLPPPNMHRVLITSSSADPR